MSSVTSYPPHGIHVYINNRFRDPISQPAYKFRCPQFAQPNNDNGAYIAVVKKVVTENFIYTITSGQNDVLCWNVGGTEYIYEVPQGNYTIDSLLVELNAVLSTYGVAMAYDIDLRKVVITKTLSTVFYFVDPQSVVTLQAGNLVKRANRFLHMLGLYSLSQAGTVLSGVMIMDDPVNLNRTGAIFINIYNNINVLHSDIRNPQTITSVPFDVAYGEKVVYLPPQPPTFIIRPMDLESLAIYVTDVWGEEVQVPDNTGLLIHLVLYPIPVTQA